MFYTPKTQTIAVATLLACVALQGCRITSRGTNGKEDVDISTPLGGLAVKTDPAAVLGKIGLPQYPGAVAVKDPGTDKDSADVNLSFGSFRLRVLALGFQTDDDRGKVEAFYRKALGQYSDVIACQNENPVGQPSKTGLGLTCKGDRHVHADLQNDTTKKPNDPDLTLKAGSPSRQHLVTLRSLQNGTHFSLVALDLPKDNDSN